MASVSNSMSASKLDRTTILFYVIYWITFLCLAARPTNLHKYVTSLFPDATDAEIRNKIYCMELAGWIKRLSYSGHDYFYTLYGTDPFDYRFKPEVGNRDTIRRRMTVTLALQKEQSIPKYIKKVATDVRGAAAP
jgi:hypothetical protein